MKIYIYIYISVTVRVNNPRIKIRCSINREGAHKYYDYKLNADIRLECALRIRRRSNASIVSSKYPVSLIHQDTNCPPRQNWWHPFLTMTFLLFCIGNIETKFLFYFAYFGNKTKFFMNLIFVCIWYKTFVKSVPTDS